MSNQEFNIILILLILVFVVIFIHSIVTLCLIVVKNKGHEQISRAPSYSSARGFAQPRRPVQVVLARDEELGFAEEEEEFNGPKSIAPPPPAYGFWRGSVVSLQI